MKGSDDHAPGWRHEGHALHETGVAGRVYVNDVELPRAEKDNSAPEGFTALFNGNNLDGWKGLLKSPNDNPIKRAALTPEQTAEAQKEADDDMRAHWRVENGEFVFDGKGRSLCTAKDYANFELLVDWKIPAHGDSGIYFYKLLYLAGIKICYS